jgi:DNA-binding transcriptional ArsR family regulator
MKSTAAIFRALADPTRREILQSLRAKDLPAGEIAGLFDISAPAVSRHLSILKAAELVTERREGNRIIYKLEPERLALCLNGFVSAVCPTQIFHRKSMRKGSGK